MKTYKVKVTDCGGPVVWDDIEAVINEIRTHLTEGTIGQEIIITIDEMDEEEFNSLPEFEGF